MGEQPSAATRARDLAQHRRAGPADRRDPAGQPAGRAARPTWAPSRAVDLDRPGRRGVRAHRRRAGSGRRHRQRRAHRARRAAPAAPRHPQPAGERAPLRRRRGQPSSWRPTATRPWCASTTAARACRAAVRERIFEPFYRLARRQRARRRRRPGPGAGALDHPAPPWLGEMRGPGWQRRMLRWCASRVTNSAAAMNPTLAAPLPVAARPFDSHRSGSDGAGVRSRPDAARAD